MEPVGHLALLKAFFCEYVSKEVFAVRPTCGRGWVGEYDGPLLPGKQEKLLSWCLEYRWKFFVRSQLHMEYKLCSRIIGHSHKPTPRPASPRQQWCDGDLRLEWLVLAGRSASSSEHAEYKHLRGFIAGTRGETVLLLWVSLEAWQRSRERSWTALRQIKEQCSLLPGLIKFTYGGSTDADAWVETLKKECEERLVNYWLPRLRQGGPRLTTVCCVMSYDMSCDPNQPFVNGLRYNQEAGRPFEEFLMSFYGPYYAQLVKFWEALDKLLLTVQSRGEQEVLRESWRLWSEYISDDCRLDEFVCEDNRSSLLRSLRDSNQITAVQALSLIQNELLSTLKRIWTEYLRHDLELYQRHVNDNSSSACPRLTPHTPLHKTRQSRKRNQRKKLDSLNFDLKGTPLEPLEDLETLKCFEEFMVSSCGPLSKASLHYYQLWKELTKLSQIRDARSRDALAVHIHRTFLHSEAKRSVHLPESLLEQVNVMEAMARPSTATLKSLTELSSRLLEKTVNRFLGCDQSGNEEEGAGPLPAFDCTKKPRGAKTSSAMQRTEFQHLMLTLNKCVGPVSHQLSSFSLFLEDQGPPSQQGQLSNNVCFWLEVSKFKAMFINETSSCVLNHKAEAVVDRYLDSASQPWIKVTLPSELVAEIVSALGDSQRSGGRYHLERLYQLLDSAQELAFGHMALYWAAFCAQYTSPDGPTIAAPQAVEPCPPRSKRSTLPLPPITRATVSASLLSFSSIKGLKWKTCPQPPT